MAAQLTEVGAVVDAVERLSKPQVVDLKRGNENEAIAAAVPTGFELRSVKGLLDEYRILPERKKGIATITQLDAFIAYVNRHKDAQSVAFLDDTDARAICLRAVFNPHGAQETATGFGDFGCTYPFPLSDAWKAWSVQLVDMPQGAFAAFLEDRIVDVIDPSEAGKTAADLEESLGITLAGVARLLELSRGLSIAVGQRVSQAVNTSTGEGHIVFAEEHKDDSGKPLKVPGGFAIAIPVFRLDAAYKIAVRLRYRREGAALLWTLHMHGVDRVLEVAVKEAGEKVAQETGLPVFRGAPAR